MVPLPDLVPVPDLVPLPDLVLVPMRHIPLQPPGAQAWSVPPPAGPHRAAVR